MRDFVAYHSTDKWGRWFPTARRFRFWSGKSPGFLRQAVGANVWTFVSTRDAKGNLAYHFAGVFTPSEVRAGRNGHWIAGNGEAFKVPPDVTDRPGFRQLLRQQGNFRFGFSRLRNHALVKALRRLRVRPPHALEHGGRQPPAPARYQEGEARQVTSDAYERNRQARSQCIGRYGCRCVVCGFDFLAVYGELGRGFIHVHHLKAPSEIRNKHKVDPVRDLRPVCPNCHAMIHAGKDMLSVAALKALVGRHAGHS